MVSTSFCVSPSKKKIIQNYDFMSDEKSTIKWNAYSDIKHETLWVHKFVKKKRKSSSDTKFGLEKVKYMIKKHELN